LLHPHPRGRSHRRRRRNPAAPGAAAPGGRLAERGAPRADPAVHAGDEPDRGARARPGGPPGRRAPPGGGPPGQGRPGWGRRPGGRGGARPMSHLGLASVSLFALLLATALAITRLRALYEATMLTALAGLLSASLFVALDALDVAITEAAVGTGISTVLFIAALRLTRSREAVTPRRRLWSGGAVAVLLGATLVYAAQDLPPFAEPDTPVQTH